MAADTLGSARLVAAIDTLIIAAGEEVTAESRQRAMTVLQEMGDEAAVRVLTHASRNVTFTNQALAALQPSALPELN